MHIFIYFLFLLFVLYSVELFRFGVDFVLSVIWILVFFERRSLQKEIVSERKTSTETEAIWLWFVVYTCAHYSLVNPFLLFLMSSVNVLISTNHHQVFFEIIVLNQFTNNFRECLWMKKKTNEIIKKKIPCTDLWGK